MPSAGRRSVTDMALQAGAIESRSGRPTGSRAAQAVVPGD